MAKIQQQKMQKSAEICRKFAGFKKNYRKLQKLEYFNLKDINLFFKI